MPPKARKSPPVAANGSTDSTSASSTDTRDASRSLVVFGTLAGLTAVAAYNLHQPYAVSAIFGIAGFVIVADMIPRTRDTFFGARMTGFDQCKQDRTEVPEPGGIVACLVYLMLLFVFIPIPFLKYMGHKRNYAGDGCLYSDVARAVNSPEAVPLFPHEKLVELLSALLTISSMVLLGFADDVFDVRWRTKIALSAVACAPFLLVYYANIGVTAVMVPLQLRPYLGSVVDLGVFYYAIMACFSMFFTNSINLVAGINGVEVSQSIVIALSVVVNDALYLLPPGATTSDARALESHLFSSYLLLPFVGVSWGLLVWNWYPSKTFVGDTYTYFAGITFAVVAVLSHFSKTMMLFFLPQLFNFVLSVPQLFKIVPCPRHRLPKYVPERDHLIPSRAEFTYSKSNPPPFLTNLALRVFHFFGLIDLTLDPATGYPASCSNFTILCFLLYRLGPMREDRLCMAVIAVQVLGSAVAFGVRYGMSRFFYDVDVAGGGVWEALRSATGVLS